MSAVSIFEIKDAKKGRFFVISAPMGIILGLFFRYLCEASKKYNFAIFFKI